MGGVCGVDSGVRWVGHVGWVVLSSGWVMKDRWCYVGGVLGVASAVRWVVYQV